MDAFSEFSQNSTGLHGYVISDMHEDIITCNLFVILTMSTVKGQLCGLHTNQNCIK